MNDRNDLGVVELTDAEIELVAGGCPNCKNVGGQVPGCPCPNPPGSVLPKMPPIHPH